VESFERQLQVVITELYRQKAETVSWQTSKMAIDQELAATRLHLANVERALKGLEHNADARADALRPFLRTARCASASIIGTLKNSGLTKLWHFCLKIFILINFRLELIRSYVDLGNAKVKREQDKALSLWRRSMSIWEV
jgi:hypothetical protein